MEKIGIQTSQNVIIKQNLATVGERILATALDYFLYAIYLTVVIFIIIKAVPSSNQQDFLFIFILPVLFFSTISEIIMHGQTLGKKVVKIQVVKIDGTQPGISGYIIRWFFSLVDIWLLYGSIGLVTIIINGKGQRLGDIVAKTSVISMKIRSNINQTIYVETPEDYQLNFEKSHLLNEGDIRTILDVLAHYQQNMSQPQASILVRETAEVIKHKIGTNFSTNPLDFLRRVVYDFNYIHKRSTKV